MDKRRERFMGKPGVDGVAMWGPATVWVGRMFGYIANRRK